MASNYQLSYQLQVFDKMSSTLDKISAKLEAISRLENRVNKNSLNDAELLALKKTQLSNKIERDAITFNQRQADRADRVTKSAITSQKKIEIEAERNAGRETRRLKEMEKNYQSYANKIGLYVSAPAMLIAGLSLKAHMNMEQVLLKLNLEFGKDAKEMRDFAKDYALKTAFNIQDASMLMTSMKAAGEKMGLTSNQQVKDMTKSVGDVLLAYAPSTDARSGISEQLRQIFSRGYAEQTDVKIMSAHGLNINRLAEQVGVEKSGRTWTSKEILLILELTSKTEKVQKAILENAKSLTQAWDTQKESINAVLAGIGKTYTATFELVGVLQNLSSLWQKFANKLDSDTGNVTKSVTTFLLSWLMFVGPALIVIGHLRKIISLVFGVNMALGSVKASLMLLRSRALVFTGIFSSIYAITADWKGLFHDMNTEGFTGLLKHVDLLIAGLLTVGTIVAGVSQSMSLLKQGKLKTASAVAIGTLAIAGGLGYSVYKGASKATKENAKQQLQNLSGENPMGQTHKDWNLLNQSQKDWNTILMPKGQTPVPVEVYNNINVDKSGNTTIETTQKQGSHHKKPQGIFANPVYITQ